MYSWEKVDCAAAGKVSQKDRCIVGRWADVDLTLGLVWYVLNEYFVFDVKNEVLKTGAKCSSPVEVGFRCPGRPRLRVRDGMETGRKCVNAAVTHKWLGVMWQ